jgi:TRAP-type C4-dicarboxylate transport system permease small subunit
MDALNRIVGGLGQALLAVAVLGVMLSVLVGTVDVVGTQAFLSPLHGATESITELMVIIVFIALPWVQRARRHIRVELLYSHLGPRAQATLDALTAAAGLLFFGLLLWQSLDAAAASWGMRESTLSVVRIPIYPAKLAIVLGVAVAMLQLLVDFVASARAALGETHR